MNGDSALREGPATAIELTPITDRDIAEVAGLPVRQPESPGSLGPLIRRTLEGGRA